MKCTNCGATAVSYKAPTGASPAARFSAKHHADEAAEAFKKGDIARGIRHVVTPFLGPLASKAAEAVVRWRCLKCGSKF